MRLGFFTACESPIPRNAAVKGSAIAWMKNSRLVRRSRVGDRIHRGSKTFVGQIFRFQKNGEPFLRLISNLESKKRIGVGEERVGLVDWITREVPLHVRSGVKAGCSQVKQFRFIEMLRDARDAVVAIDRIIIEMKIVQRVGLI